MWRIRSRATVVLGIILASFLFYALHILRENCVATTPKNTPNAHPAEPPEPQPLHLADLIASYVVPNNVFYVWCGAARQFEFRHYLSVLSVIHFLQPDNIDWFYDVEPTVDRLHYSTWLTEIADRYPFFRTINDTGACANVSGFVDDRLIRVGGIYVDERVVLAAAGHELRKLKSVVIVDADGHDVVKAGSGPSDMNTDISGTPRTVFRCISSSSYMSTSDAPCVLLERLVHPKYIWELDSPLGRLLRTVAYGSPELARPEPSYDQLVPNIGHVVWIGGGRMNFDFFLCVLSLLHVAEVDTVYIHGSAPKGFYWDLVKTDSRVKVIPRTVGPYFGRSKRTGPSVMSDVWRLDVLMKYGGIYLDTDALMVRPLTREIRGYDAVGTLDIVTAVGTSYPDTMNLGVMIAKPRSKFCRLLQRAAKDASIDDVWSLGVRLPYKIKERHPDTLLVEPRLQVLCFNSECRPTWGTQYQNRSVNHLTSDFLKNWTTNIFAFHMTFPVPTEFQSHKKLLSSASMIGDIGLNVLRKSGMLARLGNRIGS